MSLISRGLGTDMKAREGDFIETFDGNIFDVKGLVHPPDRIIAFIRFTPDPTGERTRDNTRYSKVYPLHERYELLRRKFPQYLVFDSVFNQWLCQVPNEMVKKHYEPSTHLGQLRRNTALGELEKQTIDLARLLHVRAGVKWRTLGFSGSLLVGLHTSKSDIDLVVYGSQNCQKVYRVLKSLVHGASNGVKRYDERDLKTLFDFRSKDTKVRFEDFVRTESRKVLQGKFNGRDYFIRCIKDWKEVTETYGSIQYKPMGEATVNAIIADDSQMIFTPCSYRTEDVNVLKGQKQQAFQEIVSFRGRFCEQARKGERVIARGMVESLKGAGKEYFRLLLGNTPSDFMILAN